MTVLCAFGPPILFDVGNTGETKDELKKWAFTKMMEMEQLSQSQIERKAYEFFKHLIEDSNLHRDMIWLKIDRAFLEYFHLKNQLLFKKDVNIVKKSHQDKYVLDINTKFI